MSQLSGTPQHHPDCCLSLSIPLLHTVHRYAQRIRHNPVDGTMLLSIGAGTGLFESHLTSYFRERGMNNVRVEAVEVQSAITTYLPVDAVHRVRGTWDISDQARNANVLLFVYPREAQLVERYLQQFHGNVQFVLWFGPRADWVEHDAMLHDIATFNSPVVLEDTGLAPYEVAAVMENKVYKARDDAIVPTRHENLTYQDVSTV